MAAVSKRARVMGRSRKLGHCICDPRKPCPCDVFVEHDVCTCAGERLDGGASRGEPAALTRLVKNAGCASKIPPADLARVLGRLPKVTDPRVLVGTGTADDAGVFQVSPELCLVQTVDVFAPCVDDPYQFGQIAACNSLSDCYAMGGTPLTALSIIGYPIRTLSDEWMHQMLRGGMDKLEEAGVALIGGHSINDEEMKFGFAITGVVKPDEVVTNAGAQPEDALILTKRIGTGIVAFAAQIGRASEESVRAAGESMATLNRAASEVMREVGAHACTDVTGFGLLGHMCHMVRESGVTVEVWWDAIPTFPGVRELAREGMISGAAERNREFAAEMVEVGGDVPEEAVDILYDAQTSGGLLLSVAEDRAEEALAELRRRGCSESAIIGRIVGRSKGAIAVTGRETSAAPDASRGAGGDGAVEDPSGAVSAAAQPAEGQAAEEECCAPGSVPAEAGAARKAFSEFMGAAFAPGALDVVQKELTTIALSVATQCEPCIKLHLAKAERMGISREEIEEAAWMGVAFGGASAMMFWAEASRALGTDRGPGESK
jgi:selenide,water dikinase